MCHSNMTGQPRGAALYGPCFELASQELARRLGLESTWVAHTRPYFAEHTLELKHLPRGWSVMVDFGPDGRVQRRVYVYGRFQFPPGRRSAFERELSRWERSANFRDITSEWITVKHFGPYQAMDCARRTREVALWMATEVIYLVAAAARIGPPG